MNPSLQCLVEKMETLLDDTTSRVASHDGMQTIVIESEVGRLARYRCAEYLRLLGIRDPEVKAKMSGVFVRRAIDVLEGADREVIENRLVPISIELIDNYVQKWIIGIEKQIDLHGGMSRCGEIALKMAVVLAKHPLTIESVEAAVPFFKDDVTLSMPAQPPNNPSTFADQPLTASQGGVWSELWLALSSSFRQIFASERQWIFLSPSLDRRSR